MKTTLNLTTHSPDDSHVEFDGDAISLFMSRKQWCREGQPSTVTVTVEPGNKLRS